VITSRRRTLVLRTCAAFALGTVTLAACADHGASTVTVSDAGAESDALAPVTEGGAADVDAQPSHLPVLPVALPPLSTIPLLKASIIPVSTGAPFDYDGALLEDTATGHVAVVFERLWLRSPMARSRPHGRTATRPI
jgi:hypothetical protein